jgi:hypothetical protein
MMLRLTIIEEPVNGKGSMPREADARASGVQESAPGVNRTPDPLLRRQLDCFLIDGR